MGLPLLLAQSKCCPAGLYHHTFPAAQRLVHHHHSVHFVGPLPLGHLKSESPEESHAGRSWSCVHRATLPSAGDGGSCAPWPGSLSIRLRDPGSGQHCGCCIAALSALHWCHTPSAASGVPGKPCVPTADRHADCLQVTCAPKRALIAAPQPAVQMLMQLWVCTSSSFSSSRTRLWTGAAPR